MTQCIYLTCATPSAVTKAKLIEWQIKRGFEVIDAAKNLVRGSSCGLHMGVVKAPVHAPPEVRGGDEKQPWL